MIHPKWFLGKFCGSSSLLSTYSVFALGAFSDTSLWGICWVREVFLVPPQLPLPAHKSGLACNTYQLLCFQEISLRWPQNIITIFLSLASHTSFSSGLYQWPFPPLNIQITMYFEKTLPLWKLPFLVADHWLLYSHFSTIDSYHCSKSHSWLHWHKTTHWGQDSGL